MELDPKLRRLLTDTYLTLHSAEIVIRDPAIMPERDRIFIADTIRLVERAIVEYTASEQAEEAQ